MILPEVSVVMSVYNGALQLEETLLSVLSQKGCNFEFIIVNDGSTDNTAQILNSWASRDTRLRLIHQENTGLTKALMRGCAEARGVFIARQDSGDVSLPGRLATQCSYLRSHKEVVLVCCSAIIVGPENEPLFSISRIGEELGIGLANLDVKKIKGPPHHGATMFRRDAYEKSGGYRQQFVVAQDIDLWLRLAELGKCWGIQEILYQAKLAANSISGRYRNQQFRAGMLAIECAKIRRNGNSDQTCLERESFPPTRFVKSRASRLEKSRFYYFIGSCLLKQNKFAAKKYFIRAASENPFSLKAIARSFLI